MTARHSAASDASGSASSDVRIILFDVGGVLVETTGVAVLLEWAEHRFSLEDFWRFWFSSPAVRAFETGRSEPVQFATEVLRELNLDLPPHDFLTAFATWPARLYPGVPELLARIPPSYTRAVLSNTNAVQWPRVMDDLGLGAAFEHRFASHIMGRVKPDAQAFAHALESLRCAPSEVLFLDDSELNVAAARRLGIQAIRVCGATEAERALVLAGVIRD